MDVEDKMRLWWNRDEGSGVFLAESTSRPSPSPLPLDPDNICSLSSNSALLDSYSTDDEEEPVGVYMPELDTYRSSIIKSFAYEWLLVDLRKFYHLAPSSPDVMAEIRQKILQSMPSHTRVSRREGVSQHKMTYTLLNWDLISFLVDQEYSVGNMQALSMVITIRALTCAQYLHQTWPSSAGEILKFFQSLVGSGSTCEVTGMLMFLYFFFSPTFFLYAELYLYNNIYTDCLPKETKGHSICLANIEVSGSFSDGTKLRGWLDHHENPTECKIRVEVVGHPHSIAEVGEQLSWLGSALRSSPSPDQLAYFQPELDKIHVAREESHMSNYSVGAELKVNIRFVLVGTKTDLDTNGDCWHHLFRNCVIAEGFPICRRPELLHVNGLEIPLGMMARLAQSNRVYTFLGNIIIKGFSTMIILTEIYPEVAVWHLVHNRNGDRVSYLDHSLVPTEGAIASELPQKRHVLGWCSEVKCFAGAIPDIF